MGANCKKDSKAKIINNQNIESKAKNYCKSTYINNSSCRTEMES